MGRRIKPMEGERFGLLRVIRFSHIYRTAFWVCLCDCGKTVTVCGANLRQGNTRSCGCYMKERSGVTHGLSGSPEYKTYKYARRRCTKPTDKSYASYGGRGIEWHFTSFKEFYAALGPKPTPEHTLERKDVNGPYSADNCIWATWDVQYANRRNSLKNKRKVDLSVP